MKEPSAPEPPLGWRLDPTAASLVTVVWAAVVYALYLAKTPISVAAVSAVAHEIAGAHLWHPYAWKAAHALLLGGWILAAAASSGAFVLDRLLPGSLLPAERWSFGLGLGLGALSVLTFLCGVAGWWVAPVFWAVLIAATALSALAWLRPGPTQKAPNSAGRWSRAPAFLLACFGAAFVAGALMPEMFFDSLFYHLGVPNLYRLEHRIHRLDLIYSAFVMTPQMLWGFALTLGDELVAKILHVGAIAGLGLALVAFGQRWLSPGSGALAALLFVSAPVVGSVVTRAGVDGAWAFFAFLACSALVRALAEAQPRWLGLAGALAGLAASCRYQGFVLLPVSLAVLVSARRWEQGRDWRAVARDAARFLAPALAVVGLYLLEHTWFHHNPVYPFGGTWLGEPPIAPDRLAAFLGDAARSAPSPWYRVLHPWFMVMGEPAVYDGHTGPLYLALLPLLFALRPRVFALRVLWRLFLLLWLVWVATSPYTPRYALPALALLAPLFAEGIASAPRWRRTALLACVAVGTLANLCWTWVDVSRLGGLAVLGGQQDVHEYLAAARPTYPTPPYRGIRWMNEHLPADARVLFLGDSRSYYIDRRALPSSVYEPQPIALLASRAADGEELARLFRQQRLTHVFLNWGEAFRTESYRTFAFDEASWKTLAEFWSRSARLVWKEEKDDPADPRALYVFEILSEQEAAKPHPAAPNPFLRWAR